MEKTQQQRWPEAQILENTDGKNAQLEDDEEEEEFIKVADLVPDLHCVNSILKVFEIEAVVIQDPTACSLHDGSLLGGVGMGGMTGYGMAEGLSSFDDFNVPSSNSISTLMNIGKNKANTLKQLIDMTNANQAGSAGGGSGGRGSESKNQRYHQ